MVDIDVSAWLSPSYCGFAHQQEMTDSKEMENFEELDLFSTKQ